VTPGRLAELVARVAVPRPRGSAEHRAARRVVTDLLAAAVGGGVTADAVGNVLAGDPNTARVIVGAHYDAVAGTPGADDNGSGVAAVLAAAEAVSPASDVCFVLFDGEEDGLVGSRAVVAGLGGHRPAEVHVLDTVGYAAHAPGSQRNPVPGIDAPTVGDFLGLVGNRPAAGALDRVRAAADCHPLPVQALYLPDVPVDGVWRASPHLLRSDHAPFWRAGLPAVFWTDTAEFRNPHYHRPTDAPGTLNYPFLAGVARLLAHTVLGG
jgi:Zn-dependent M28 family amino/carboxypeptidase